MVSLCLTSDCWIIADVQSRRCYRFYAAGCCPFRCKERYSHAEEGFGAGELRRSVFLQSVHPLSEDHRTRFESSLLYLPNLSVEFTPLPVW